MIEIYAEMGKKLIIRKVQKEVQFSGKKTLGKQEGWNSGTRNFKAQKIIDDRRAARRKKYIRQGRNCRWGDHVRYRGIY